MPMGPTVSDDLLRQPLYIQVNKCIYYVTVRWMRLVQGSRITRPDSVSLLPCTLGRFVDAKGLLSVVAGFQ